MWRAIVHSECSTSGSRVKGVRRLLHEGFAYCVGGSVKIVVCRFLSRRSTMTTHMLNVAKSPQFRLVTDNVASHLPKPNPQNERDRIATMDEWLRLKGAAAPHLRQFLVVPYALGPRRGELLKLEWSDVDMRRSGHGGESFDWRMGSSMGTIVARWLRSLRNRGFIGTVLRALSIIEEGLFDLRYGTDTVAFVKLRPEAISSPNASEGVDYVPTRILPLRKVLAAMNPGPDSFPWTMDAARAGYYLSLRSADSVEA